MTSTLQNTQREAKIDGQIKNCAGKQFATPPQPTLSVAGFRSDKGMCLNQFTLFTIVESIIYRVYGMIYHLRIAECSLTSLNLLLTNFRTNRSKTEMFSQKTKLLLGSTSLTVGTHTILWATSDCSDVSDENSLKVDDLIGAKKLPETWLQRSWGPKKIKTRTSVDRRQS